MKKLVTGILAMLLCFGCLAGCGDSNSSESSSSTPEVSTPDASTPDASTPDESTPDESTPDASTPDESTPDTSSPDDGGEVTPQPHEADLKDVKDFIYSPMLDEATESTKSYTVKNSYSFYQEEAVYDIAWAVTDVDGNAINGVTIEEGEAEDTVVISETLPETVSYVLTGTISCPDGCCSLSFSLNRVAVAAPAPVAITEAPVEGTAYKFYVYQGNKKVDCYPTGNMKNTYYFETTTDYAASLDFFVENVEGGFHLYHVADGVKIYINVVKSGTHTNAKYQTIEENASPNVWTFNTEWKTITTTLSDGTYYLGCDGSYDTVEPQYKVEDGYFMGYLVTMVDKSQIVITDETKVNTIKDSLNVVTKHTLDKTVSLTTSDDRYPEVSIVWTVEEGKGASVTAEGLVLAIPAEATTAVLTATVSCGEVTEIKEFTLELGPKTEAPDATNAEAIVNAAFNLADGETLPGDSYTLTGVIKNVKTAYSTDYQNVTVIITVGEKEIECYRMKGEGADVIKAGDTITVTGKIKNYKGTVEFDQGCTLDSYTASEGGETPDVGGDEEPSVQAPAADSVLTIKEALAYGNTLTAPTTDKYYVSGTITGFYGNGGKTYGNVYIQDENGDSILVYGLYSADGSVRYDEMEVKPVEGDTIKVYGALTSYKGVGQFKDAWLIEHTPAAGGETPDVGGETETTSTTYTFANYTAGTQYALNEIHTLDDVVTVTTNDAHFTSEIRLYDNQNNDGTAVIASTKTITSATFKAGNKAGTLQVYGSVDGETWVLIQEFTTASAYADFTVNCADAGYKFLKLDAIGAQIRVKTMTLNFAA